MTMKRGDTIRTRTSPKYLQGRVIAVQGPAPTDLVRIDLSGNTIDLTQVEFAKRYLVVEEDMENLEDENEASDDDQE